MLEVETADTVVGESWPLPRRMAIGTLRLFQLCISPLYNPCCRFYPSCSQYAIEAITKFGTVRGMWLTAARLARCHPLAKAGVDLVPETFELLPWRNDESANKNLNTHEPS